MNSFSPSDAALEGFRIARENPVAIGIWAVLQLVLTVATYVLLIVAAGPQIQVLIETYAVPGAKPDPQQMMQVMNQASAAILPIYLPLLAVSLALKAVQSAAVMRVVLRPSQSSPGFLRLGGDELRIFAVMVVKTLIFACATLIGGMACGLVIALMGPLGALIAVLIFFGLLGGVIFVALRLSLSTPQTFAEGRIMIFQSWNLTAGRLGPILGCYLLAVVLAMVVLIVSAIATGMVSAIAAMAFGGAPKVDFSTLAHYFTPLQMFNVVLGSLVGALVLAITSSPPAMVYRALTGRSQSAVF